MKRIFVALFLSIAGLVCAISAFADVQATVFDFRGKVDVLVPGGAWQPVQKGMVIGQGTTISTGFNATAVLRVAESTVTVQQLTRLRLDELLQKQGRLTTSFTLPIGRIQAQVRSADGSPQDFQIHSAVATAAVRGTEFDFNGNKLIVQDGLVAFYNSLGQMVFVSHGQESSTTGTNTPSSPQDQLSGDTQLPGAGSGLPTGGGLTGSTTTGTIVVTWQ